MVSSILLGKRKKTKNLTICFKLLERLKMNERQFCDESKTTKPAVLNCPSCGHRDTYDLRWLVRKKKKSLQTKSNEEANAQFAKFQSYMVLLDDMVQCANPHCRRRVEASGIKTVAYLMD